MYVCIKCYIPVRRIVIKQSLYRVKQTALGFGGVGFQSREYHGIRVKLKELQNFACKHTVSQLIDYICGKLCVAHLA